jgi:hypothetical protein
MLLIIWLTFDNVCLQLQHTKCAAPQASCRRPTWVCASWESRERSAAPNAFSPLARVARAASGCLELHPPRALARSMSARHSCMQSEAGIRVLRPSRVVPCESRLHLHFGRRSRNARAGCPSPADLINSTTFLQYTLSKEASGGGCIVFGMIFLFSFLPSFRCPYARYSQWTCFS